VENLADGRRKAEGGRGGSARHIVWVIPGLLRVVTFCLQGRTQAELIRNLSVLLGTDEIDLVVLNAGENVPLVGGILKASKVVFTVLDIGLN